MGMEQLAMLLPTRSAHRIADPLSLPDLRAAGLPAGISKRLGEALEARPPRLMRVASAIANGQRPVFELARVGDIRTPPALRLPQTIADELPHHPPRAVWENPPSRVGTPPKN